MRNKDPFCVLATIISVILLYGCNSESNKKSPPYPSYSATLSDSKKNGFFQFEVIADKSVVTLDSALKFEIKSAWVENCWWRQVLMFGKSPMWKEDSSYQLILKLNINSLQNNNRRYYYFVGNRHLDTFIYYNCRNYYSNRIDTIKVPLYRELTPDLSSRKERKAFDTLTFVKRIIN
jgi:hypothetical protein